MTEKERVEQHSKIANYAGGIMTYATAYCGKIFERHMKKRFCFGNGTCRRGDDRFAFSKIF